MRYQTREVGPQSCSVMIVRRTATAAATSSAVSSVSSSRSATAMPFSLRASLSRRRPFGVSRTNDRRASVGSAARATSPCSSSCDTAPETVGCEERSTSANAVTPCGPSSSRRDRIRMPAGCPTRRRTARTSRAAYTTSWLLCSSRSVGISAEYRDRAMDRPRPGRQDGAHADVHRVPPRRQRREADVRQSSHRAGVRGRRMHRRRDLHQHRQRACHDHAAQPGEGGGDAGEGILLGRGVRGPDHRLHAQGADRGRRRRRGARGRPPGTAVRLAAQGGTDVGGGPQARRCREGGRARRGARPRRLPAAGEGLPLGEAEQRGGREASRRRHQPQRQGGPDPGREGGGGHMSCLVVTRHGPVLTLTLDRPEQLNALTDELSDSLATELEAAAAYDDVRVVVLRGAGHAFCAGADIAGADAPMQLDVRALDRANRIVRAVTRLDKPVVAAVHGPAAGVGCSIALACDLAVAAESSSFLLAFARVGLMPDGGSSTTVAASIGRARAMRMALLGEPLPASAALDAGLVTHVVPDDELPAPVARLAGRLAAGPPIALAGIKKAVNAATLSGLEAALDREHSGQRALFTTRDFTEGLDAFADG